MRTVRPVCHNTKATVPVCQKPPNQIPPVLVRGFSTTQTRKGAPMITATRTEILEALELATQSRQTRKDNNEPTGNVDAYIDRLLDELPVCSQ